MTKEKTTAEQTAAQNEIIKPPPPSAPGSYTWDGKAWVPNIRDKAMKQTIQTR